MNTVLAYKIVERQRAKHAFEQNSFSAIGKPDTRDPQYEVDAMLKASRVLPRNYSILPKSQDVYNNNVEKDTVQVLLSLQEHTRVHM